MSEKTVSLFDVIAEVRTDRRESWLEPEPPATTALFASVEPPAPVIDIETTPEFRARLEEKAAEQRREIRAELEGKLEEQRGRMVAAVCAIEEAAARSVDVLAGEVVELALAMAEEVIGAEVECGSAVVRDVVRDVIASVADDSEIVVRAHPDDVEWIQSQAETVSRPKVRVIADETISLGGVLVENKYRIVDARIEERLEAVKRGLIDLFQQAEAEQQPC